MTDRNSSLYRPKPKQDRPLSATLVFEGKLFEVWQWEQEQYNGSKAIFETLRRPDTVLILPVLDDHTVIFAYESQPGMPAMLRTVGGRVEPGELPEEAAQRELVEETGYSAQEYRLWNAWQPLNKIDWVVYLFIAHGVRPVADTTLDAGEKIQLHKIPVVSLLDKNVELKFDDYELLHQLYFARADDIERERVLKLLNPNIV